MIIAFQVIVLVVLAIASLLRIRNAQSAVYATWVASILLAPMIPIGTGVFIWWLIAIRPKEPLPGGAEASA